MPLRSWKLTNHIGTSRTRPLERASRGHLNEDPNPAWSLHHPCRCSSSACLDPFSTTTRIRHRTKRPYHKEHRYCRDESSQLSKRTLDTTPLLRSWNPISCRSHVTIRLDRLWSRTSRRLNDSDSSTRKIDSTS